MGEFENIMSGTKTCLVPVSAVLDVFSDSDLVTDENFEVFFLFFYVLGITTVTPQLNRSYHAKTFEKLKIS